MAITFKDVAKLAGVSSQTVSRVTNGADNVSDETRQKVNQAIQALGYVPNKGAQMLSRTNSQVIGILSLHISLHGAAMITNGIRQQAQQANYSSAFAVVESHANEELKIAVRDLISHQAEIIIVNFPLSKQQALSLTQQFTQLHFVFIDIPTDTPLNSVCCDDQKGAQLAAQHLLDLGRQDFVLIAGPNSSYSANQRLQAWIDTITPRTNTDNKKSIKANIVAEFEGNWEAKSGYRAMKEVILEGQHFDAVLVGNDQMALGALHALHQYKIDVPNCVSITGFDDTNDSAFFTPALTTIHQDFEAIGKAAVRLGIEQLAHKKSSTLAPPIESRSTQHITIPVQLIKRSSTNKKNSSKRISNQDQILKQLDDIKQLLIDT